MWLRWVAFLATQPGGDSSDLVLIIAGTQKVTPAQWKSLRSAVGDNSKGMFLVAGHILEDDGEGQGYPGAASHLFLRTLEYCETTYPGSSVLWLEADTVPMRPGWAQEIEAEYADCGKPFLGYLEAEKTMPHMAGVAVYPPDWRTRSPLLAGVLAAPDTKQWGHGKGQAFDIYAASEIVPQMARAKTIQQIWRPQPFNAMPTSILPTTALFHQCKDASLINVIAKTRYPEFAAAMQPPREALFAVRGHHLNKVSVGGEMFPVAGRMMRLIGGWWSIIKPTSAIELSKLEALAATGSVERVTKAGLDAETAKVKKMAAVRHV